MKNSSRLLVGVLVVVLAIVGVYYVSMRPSSDVAAGAKRVLVVLPLTGAGAPWGEHFKRGADMFAKTEKHPQIDVQIIDSQTNAAQALAAVQQAALRGKPYAIISTLSSVTVPLKEWTQREGVFLVACVITDKALQPPDMVQRVYPSVEANGKPIAKFAAAKFPRVGILHSNDELGIAVRKVFERDYASDGRTVALAEGYALKETEVRSLVLKVMDAKVDAVLVTGIGPAFWAIIRELKTQGYPGQILSDASFADPKQIDLLGAAADGIVFMGSETELSRPRSNSAGDFNDQFVKSFGVPVNYTGVTVYESLRMLDALARTTPKLSTGSFQSLGDWLGVPGTIRFLPGGDSDYPWFLIKREGGRNVPVN